MSTQTYPHVSTPIDPNDPRLHKLERERLPGEYDAPMSRALYKRGLRDKADRHENCRKLGRPGICPNGHEIICISSCGLRFCPRCAWGLARDTFLRHAANAALIEALLRGTGSKFVYLKIALPLARSKAEMDSVQDDVMHQLRALSGEKLRTGGFIFEVNHGDDTALPSTWTYAAGFNHDRFEIRALSLITGATYSELRALWPEAEVDVHIVPIYRLSHFLEKELFAPHLPLDADDRAEHEELFTGYRRLRTANLPEHEREEETLSVGFSDTTDKIGDDGEVEQSQPVKHAHPIGQKCPVCRAVIKTVGPWRPIDELRAEKAAARDAGPPN